MEDSVKKNNVMLVVRSSKKGEDVVIISPDGDLVINTCDVLEREVKAVLEKTPRVLVFDLEKVHYLSSMGVRVLLITQKTITRQCGTLLLVNLQPQVKKILDIVKVFAPAQILPNLESLESYLEG